MPLQVVPFERLNADPFDLQVLCDQLLICSGTVVAVDDIHALAVGGQANFQRRHLSAQALVSLQALDIIAVAWRLDVAQVDAGEDPDGARASSQPGICALDRAEIHKLAPAGFIAHVYLIR